MAKAHSVFVLLIVGWLLANAGACNRKTGKPAGKAQAPRADTRASRARPEGPLAVVTPKRAAQWAGSVLQLTDDPQVYGRGNLYELLDGGADAYIQAGVLQALSARFGKDGKSLCHLLIYRTGSPAEALRIGRKEKGETWKAVQLPKAHRAWEDAEGLVAVRGKMVLRIDPEDPQANCPFRNLAKGILADDGLPW